MSIGPGTYHAIPKAYEYGQASTGTEQIGILLGIVDENGHEVGEEITYWGYFSEKTAERTIKALRDCGWTGDDLTALEKDGFGSQIVEITLKNDTYNGQTRLKVDRLGPSGGVGMKSKMDDGAKKSFAERMRGHVLASKPTAHQAAADASKANKTARF